MPRGIAVVAVGLSVILGADSVVVAHGASATPEPLKRPRREDLMKLGLL